MASNQSVPPGAPQRAEPESFRAKALSLSLTVKELPKSLAWYRDVMGFTVDQQYEREGQLRAVALKAGEIRILLNQDDGKRGWDRTKGEGFSFQVTPEVLFVGLAALRPTAGGKLETEPADMPWGVRSFRMVDPDGYRFAVSSPRPQQ
jgi:catechol 2,3-dioxygenase-like lactoylglutathione lyase family enzyme